MKHHDHYKEPWYWECHDRGINAREATADDVLGTPIGHMHYRDEQGVVRSVVTESMFIGSDDESFTLFDIASWLYHETEVDWADNSTMVNVDVVKDVANLTKTETAIVACILDGIGSHHGYAERIAHRLDMNAKTVRVHWMNAKKKLKNTWASI